LFGLSTSLSLLCNSQRKATILSDAALMLCGDTINGGQLIDDTYLASKGCKDFVAYRYDPNVSTDLTSPSPFKTVFSSQVF
jgi:hypothetical protein